jgi:hypothetical protein
MAASELIGLSERLGHVFDSGAQKRIVTAGGIAGKKASLLAAAKSLGSDLAMSNFKKGKVKLQVGFDVVSDHEVKMNYRPDGIWILADKGRKRSKTVRRKKKQGGTFVMPPASPSFRSSFISQPSRGVGTLTDAINAAKEAAPLAAYAQVNIEIAKAIH